jgi:hypothetical protein
MQSRTLSILWLSAGAISACDAPLDRIDQAGMEGGDVTAGAAADPGAPGAPAPRGLVQQAYVKASDTASWSSFGHSVALSADGSTLAVGGDASDHAGAVYVFRRRGTRWIEQAYLRASNPDVGDRFGASVALSADGSTLAVGAFLESSAATGVGGDQADDSAVAAGAAYVFTRRGVRWTQQAYLKASNADGGDGFGQSIALSADGSTLAVAAPGEASAATGVGGDQADNSVPGAGAVYVFARSGTTWTQQAYVKASSTDPFDDFGTSVALSGDGSTLAVGAFAEDSAAIGIDGDPADDSASLAGAVHVFARTGAAWSQQAYVKASNTDEGDGFGYSVALSADGSTLAVGAFGESAAGADPADDSAPWAGAVYVFTRCDTTWRQQAYVKAAHVDAGDSFGASVALSDDGSILAVGAEGEDSAATGVGGDPLDDSATQAGAAYLFTRGAAGWTQQAYVKASNTDAFDFFGARIALSGDGSTLAVGAEGERSTATGIDGDQADNSFTLAGAVYVFGPGR